MDERGLFEKFNDMMSSGDDKALFTFMAVGFVTLVVVGSVIAGVYMLVQLY